MQTTPTSQDAQERRSIILALDQNLSAPLLALLQKNGVADAYDIIICNANSQQEADSYQTREELAKQGKKLWMLVADENMVGGESGVTFAVQVLRNHSGEYAPDAETVMYTGTFKVIADVIKRVGGARGQYFKSEDHGNKTPQMVADYIAARHRARVARQEGPAAAAEQKTPEPSEKITPMQRLEAELAEMTPPQQAQYWLQDILRQEGKESPTGARPMKNHDIAFGGPLRYQLPDGIAEVAARLGADPDRESNMELLAIAHRLQNEVPKSAHPIRG